MFDLKLEKKESKKGYADVKFYFDRSKYKPKPDLKVSIERENNFSMRHYQCEIKILREFADDTCEVKLIKSYVDHEDIKKMMGKTLIMDKKDINFKI